MRVGVLNRARFPFDAWHAGFFDCGMIEITDMSRAKNTVTWISIGRRNSSTRTAYRFHRLRLQYITETIIYNNVMEKYLAVTRSGPD